MYYIGSRALEKYDFRVPKDLDFITMESNYLKTKELYNTKILLEKDKRWGKILFVEGFAPLEYEIGKDSNLTEQLINIVENNDLLDGACVKPQVVYTMKMSHRYLKNSPHFRKTMNDIHRLRELGFGEIPNCLQDWYKARMKATYDYGHPKLKQSKDNFFSDDGLNYIYDHDTIHLTIKAHEEPAYEMIKEDKADVFCSKEKFMAAPEHMKLATVLEEAYTLALERSQIPYDFKPDRYKSFKMALEKVCTSIASGFWREYAWENYEKVHSLYNPAYVDWFKQGLENGVVKPYRS